MADIFDDDFPEDEPFEVRLVEDNNPDRPGIRIYTGIMDSPLFNANEMMLIISLLMKSNSKMEIDTINTTTISINALSKMLLINKKRTCKSIKKLEEKGVLIKERDVSPDDGDIENTYKVLNYLSVWDSTTLDELKENTDKIKKENGYG